MGVQVTFLGTGDAFSAAGRCHAAYLVTTPSIRFLLDCGPMTLMALKREKLPVDIDAIVLSHLHGDHFAGIPFFFLEYVYQSPRTRPLIIVGPRGTESRVRDLYAAMYRELALRGLPFPLDFIEVDPGVPLRAEAIAIEPFRVPHQELDISLGYRIGVDGKTILYSGDTGWTEELVKQSQGTDLFICECCYFHMRVEFHLDYPRLAENRRRLGCRRLVLTHVGADVLAQRADIGIEIADDGLVVDL